MEPDMTDEQKPEHPVDEPASEINYSESEPDNPKSNEKKSRKKYLLLGLIPVILALIGFGLWKTYQPKDIELQGRVEAETVQVATKVPSRIETIYVQEGDEVKKGQVLVKLHSLEIEAKKQQALATLQSALALQSTAERGSQEENVASLYANWQSLKAQEQLATTSYQRGANLFKEGVISRQRRDEL